ncbi:MAG: DUF2877 domain-containing protein [Acidaminobacteraceae bacterium]
MANKIVSMDLYNHLKTSETFGVVHSKFNRSINILLHDDTLVTLLTDTKDVAPMSVVCDHKTFNALNINIGDHISTTDMKFYLKDKILVDIGDYVTWEKIDKSKLVKHDLDKHKILVDILYKRIIETGNLDGIGAVVYFFDEDVIKSVKVENLDIEKNHYVNFILERLERFINDYKNCCFPKIEESFVKIIGFGPGLTPSVDDFICGLFSASRNLCEFYDVSDNYILELGEMLVKKLHLRTTRISEEMIRHCFQNNISRTYDVLLTTLLYETKEELDASISKVIEFGDTSGTDFLAGVYTACRLFEEYTIRRKFDGCKV